MIITLKQMQEYGARVKAIIDSGVAPENVLDHMTPEDKDLKEKLKSAKFKKDYGFIVED